MTNNTSCLFVYEVYTAYRVFNLNAFEFRDTSTHSTCWVCFYAEACRGLYVYVSQRFFWYENKAKRESMPSPDDNPFLTKDACHFLREFKQPRRQCRSLRIKFSFRQLKMLKFLRETLTIRICGSRSHNNVAFCHFTLFFCRERQINVHRLITHVQSYCIAHQTFCLATFPQLLQLWLA